MRLVLAFFVGIAIIGAWMIHPGLGMMMLALAVLSVIGDI